MSQRLTLGSSKSFLGREGKGDGKWMIDKAKKENRKSRGLSKFGKSTVETNEKNQRNRKSWVERSPWLVVS